MLIQVFICYKSATIELLSFLVVLFQIPLFSIPSPKIEISASWTPYFNSQSRQLLPILSQNSPPINHPSISHSCCCCLNTGLYYVPLRSSQEPLTHPSFQCSSSAVQSPGRGRHPAQAQVIISSHFLKYIMAFLCLWDEAYPPWSYIQKLQYIWFLIILTSLIPSSFSSPMCPIC